MKSDYAGAIADYTEAVRIAPKFVAAHNQLAWLLATCPDARLRNGARAVEHATKAVELNRDPNFIDTLAAACAEAGQFDKPIEMQEKALGDPRFQAETTAAECENARLRLQWYREKKPYREE